MIEQEYSDEKQAEILANVEKWSEECKKLSEYSELSEDDKENFEFITNVFADYMYGYHLKTPDKWTTSALEDVLTDIFPRKMIVQDSLYNSVEPVLILFFGYLNQLKIIKNYKSLCKSLKSASKEMLWRVDNSNNFSPMKQLLMDAMENDIDFSDTDALNKFMSKAIVPDLSFLEQQKPAHSEKIGRNEPCPCGSGRKHKHCCGQTNLVELEAIKPGEDMKSENIKPTEPTLEQWAELYEAAKNLRSIEPWNYLWDTDIITIELPGYDEPVYCSIMGRGGECYAIAIYPGNDGLLSFHRLATSSEESSLIAGLEQQCLMCNFGDREEVEPRDREVMKKLNIKFRGRNEWIYFRTMDPGYLPWYIDSEQANMLIMVLQNLAMACSHYASGKLKVNFEDGETLLRHYSPQKDLWLNQASKMPSVHENNKSYIIDDVALIARLKKQKCNKACLEFEMAYLPTPIQENKNERPYLPRLLLLMDKNSGLPLDQQLAEKNDVIEVAIISMLASYIEKFGRPASINVIDSRTNQYISDFCSKVGVKLMESQELSAIDNLLMNMLDFM